ncbi:Protein of unknown function DUF22 [Methanothermus fervidus DSM 2088]|uniref:DUF22 domain-containing protein n=1 Tax=Methanothermus fervidus (strain ATCC 43054 / DSM 2088 / JCM 10308 / V24 S) TaxID=523846 RepID=E3GX44_METFV|nr:DUF22 domain-containing protein [Methanothermus fervidus]ADP78039.1 Protein of unknown function DUF22 [Methanothermus fervidus DSM 2088]
MVKLMTRFREIVKEFEKKVHADKDFRIDSHYGLMRAIVANENIEVKSGDVKSLKIKKITIPKNHIIWICGYGVHPLGHIIAVGEEVPLPITMERSADHATFVAAKSGEIRKNDFLGVSILLPVKLLK